MVTLIEEECGGPVHPSTRFPDCIFPGASWHCSCGAAVSAAGSRSVSLRGSTVGLPSRGGTPPEPAGEDADATIWPRLVKDSVKMHPCFCVAASRPNAAFFITLKDKRFAALCRYAATPL